MAYNYVNDAYRGSHFAHFLFVVVFVSVYLKTGIGQTPAELFLIIRKEFWTPLVI